MRPSASPGSARPRGLQTGQRPQLHARDPPALQLVEVGPERVLAQARVDRRHGLLPEQGQRSIDEQQETRDDQHDRQRAERGVAPPPPAL